MPECAEKTLLPQTFRMNLPVLLSDRQEWWGGDTERENTKADYKGVVYNRYEQKAVCILLTLLHLGIKKYKTRTDNSCIHFAECA